MHAIYIFLYGPAILVLTNIAGLFFSCDPNVFLALWTSVQSVGRVILAQFFTNKFWNGLLFTWLVKAYNLLQLLDTEIALHFQLYQSLNKAAGTAWRDSLSLVCHFQQLNACHEISSRHPQGALVRFNGYKVSETGFCYFVQLRCTLNIISPSG